MDSCNSAISVELLCKSYRARETEPGLYGSIKGLLHPRFRLVEAVKNISFGIAPGERVAFIGPNGAGKSTTLKMLCGILYPSGGKAQVLGLAPWSQRTALSYQIGTVFGQRSQLWYHLPARDTFDLLARVYDLEKDVYRRRREELMEIFNLADLLAKPVRQLSLGERMRCEIVASLLHHPQVLLLDEPTVGLDVTAKAAIRRLIRTTSEREGMTVLLTSHDTGDIEGVCDRVIVINEGTLILDQALSGLRQNYIKEKIITVETEEEQCAFEFESVERRRTQPYRTVLQVDLSRTTIEAVVAALLKQAKVTDLTVEDPPLEEIIKRIYAEKGRDRA
jgi:ABC-2 type transport system ATP-binding protein